MFWMMEQLEDRCLLTAVTFPWMQAIEFDQFNGGDPQVFGFGVLDNSIAGMRTDQLGQPFVDTAPRFLGIDKSGDFSWDAQFAGTGPYAHGTYNFKLGIEYGFYVNGGTATLLHDGDVTFDVDLSAGLQGDFILNQITTSVAAVTGSLYTQSPTISAYADLVLEFDFDAHIGVTVDYFIGSDSVDIPFSVHLPKQSINLFSINRQEKDAQGRLMTGPDGAPVFDGEIKYALIQFIQGVQKSGKLFSEAVKAYEKGQADKAAANLEKRHATTAAGQQQAQDNINAANSKISQGQQDQANLKKESGKKSSFGSGVGLTVGFSPTDIDDGGTLGVKATLSAGASAGSVSVGKTLGNMTVNLPQISLTGQADATGKISASTKQFAPQSPQDIARTLATITVDPLALIPSPLPLGEYTLDVGPLSASFALATYNIKAALSVTQNVDVRVFSYPITLVFTDAMTGEPVFVEEAHFEPGGLVTSAPASTVTYVVKSSPDVERRFYLPGDITNQVHVEAFVNPIYEFSNTIGLDVGITATLDILKGSVGAFGFNGSFGPLFTTSSILLDPQDLGPIYTKTFYVDAALPDNLGFFFIGPSADLSIELVDGPKPDIAISGNNPSPLLSYTVVVTNNGPNNATDIELTALFSPQRRYEGAFITPGGFLENLGTDQNALVNIGDLPAGESRRINFAGHFFSGPGSTIKSAIGVSSETTDANLTNNEVKSNTSIEGPTIYHVLNEAELRSAVAEINNTPNPEYVPFIYLEWGFSPQVTLTQGELEISRSVTIVGSDTPIFGADINPSRFFHFNGDSEQTYRIEHVRLLYGGTEGDGGAILFEGGGTLSIYDSTLSGNTAGGAGGAIHAVGGTLDLDFDKITDNQAAVGGAFSLVDTTATFKELDVSGNEATISGSAIEQIATTGRGALTTISETAFFDNQGSNGAASIVNKPDAGSLFSTIIYEGSVFSTTATGDEDIPPNFSGEPAGGTPATFTSLGNNIANDGTGNLTAPGDRAYTQAGVFLSGTHEILSGVEDYVVGTLSLVWPKYVGKVSFNVSQQDEFHIQDGNILRLKEQTHFDINSTTQTHISIKVLPDANDDPRPGNTNFELFVVKLNVAPTAIAVDSPEGIDEAATTAEEPGTLIGRVTVADPNQDEEFTFRVDDARFHVASAPDFGYNLYLVPGQALSYLDAASIPIQITATDAGGLSVTSPYTVIVNRVVQSPTDINLVGIFVKTGEPGAVVGKLQTFSPNNDPRVDNAADEYVYTVSDSRFEVVASVLQLKAGEQIDGSASTIPIQVTSTGSTGLSVDNMFVLGSLDSALDLVVAVAESSDPATTGSGPNNLTYTVTVTNAGPNDATGVMLSNTLTMPAGVILVSTTPSAGTFANDAWNLGDLTSGSSATLTLVLTVGPNTIEGTDVITNTAAITAGADADVNAANNMATARTSVQFAVVPTRVQVAEIGFGTALSKVVISDDVLNVFDISLKGVGSAMIFMEADGRLSIDTTNTDAKSALTIKPAKGNPDSGLFSINGTGALATLAANGVNILGNIQFAGRINALTANNVADQHVIELGGMPTDKPAEITLGHVTDASLNSTGPIQLTVLSWTDTDAASNKDVITAPWITSITAKGDKKAGIPARFDASLSLSGQGATSDTLKSLKAETGSDLNFAIAGNVSSIVFTGPVSGLTANVSGLLKSLTLGDTDATTVSTDTLGAVKVVRWLAGGVTARTIKAISTSGNTKAGVAGDFSADITATGDTDAKTLELGNITIKGAAAGNWNITGSAGAIKIGTNATGALTALSVKSLAIGGNLTDAQITLTQAVDPKLKALGSLTVKGDVLRTTLRSTGNIGGFTVGAMRNSTLAAGFTGTAADLPVGLPTYFNAAATITSVTVKDLPGNNNGFVNSLIYGANVGTITLKDVQTDNAGTPFGIAAHTLKSYTRKDAAGKVVKKLSKLVAPVADADNDAMDDLVVTIV